MKKYMTKATMALAVFGFILSIGFAAQAAHNNKVSGPGASGVMANFYASNPTTVSDLKSKWGNPIHSQSYDNGIARLTFGPYDSVIGYTTFLTKNGVVVDKNFTGSVLDLNQIRRENNKM